jgi:hypothetical protein
VLAQAVTSEAMVDSSACSSPTAQFDQAALRQPSRLGAGLAIAAMTTARECLRSKNRTHRIAE